MAVLPAVTAVLLGHIAMATAVLLVQGRVETTIRSAVPAFLRDGKTGALDPHFSLCFTISHLP